MLQWQGRVLAAEAVGSADPKIFTVWLFIEEIS